MKLYGFPIFWFECYWWKLFRKHVLIILYNVLPWTLYTLVKDTTDTQNYLSYYGFHFEINNGGRLKTTSLRQMWRLHAFNFFFISSHIPAASVYGIYISQVIGHNVILMMELMFSILHMEKFATGKLQFFFIPKCFNLNWFFNGNVLLYISVRNRTN